jgi:hypothetical protein
MTTATTFSPVPEAKESSERSSVPEASGSVSNLAQQNFKTPKNLLTLSSLFLLLSSASK